jgi:hypothetical protein
MRLDTSAAAAAAAAASVVKPLDISAVRAVQNEPAGEVPSGVKNQVPQIGQDAMFLHNRGGKYQNHHWP